MERHKLVKLTPGMEIILSPEANIEMFKKDGRFVIAELTETIKPPWWKFWQKPKLNITGYKVIYCGEECYVNVKSK